MSKLLLNSPIQRLDFDLLWHVVSMNADMFNDENALETTLATSRVCRDWRALMLSMPSIWAHLIDLDHLNRLTVEFRDEMIRRSGTAFMWVKAHGRVDLDRPARYMKQVLDILDENWDRIERLDANILIEHVGPDEWAPLCRPSPHLASLNLTFIEHPMQDMKRPVLSLLGGSAPMLHTLELNAMLTTAEVLSILVLTKNLVTLKLEHTVRDEDDSRHLQVTLPNLSHLAINVFNNPLPGLLLLRWIQIPASCILSFLVLSMHPEDILSSQNLLNTFLSAISPISRHHLAYHAPQKIRIRYSGGHFELQAISKAGQPVFEFKTAMVRRAVFPPYALPSFLECFTLSCFSKVTELQFLLMGAHEPVPEFTAFTLCLPALKVIETDKLSVRHLTRAQEALRARPIPAVAFPELKTLIAVLGLLLPRSSDYDADPVSEFVMMRVAHGYPLDTVDITPVLTNRLPDDMSFIREATGLKVLWRESKDGEIFEYICGAGAP